MQADKKLIRIGKHYILPFKAVETGTIDYINAILPVTKGFNPASVSFKNNQSPVISTPSDIEGQRKLSVTGSVAGNDQTIEAIYTLTDKANKSYEKTVGMVKLSVYDKLKPKIYIVPIETELPAGLFDEIKTTIIETYKQSVVEPDLQPAALYTPVKEDWDVNPADNTFEAEDANNRNDYTAEQIKLRKAYCRDRDPENDAWYVFVIPYTTNNSLINGYTRFGKQWVFVYSKGKSPNIVAKACAHELGHAAFNLFHTFSDNNTYLLTEGSTDNLMDYPAGDKLFKYQWDFIHDPEAIWFSWLQDEEEGEMGSFLVSPMIEAIRKANIDKKESLELDQKKNASALTDNIKLGNKTLTYVGLKVGNSLAPEDLFKEFTEILKIDPREYIRSSFSYENDNEKYVKYEFHQLETTQLPSPFVNSTAPGNKTVVQFVVKASEATAFESYIYPANKEPIDNVIGTELWQAQTSGTGCYATCVSILTSAGVTSPANSRIYVAEENYEHTALVLNSTNAQTGIMEIDNSLEKLKQPIIVGVNHTLNYKVELSNNTIDFPNSDKSTDHFVVIVGRGYDASKKKIYYRFFDVFTEDQDVCTNLENRLYLQDDFYLFEMDNYVRSSSAKKYTVTQVRLNK
jgi:hypothetical protein